MTERMSDVRDASAEMSLFEQGPVVLLVWRHIPGRPVEYASANCLQVLGYSPDELMSPAFNFSALIHPEDRGRLQEEQRQNIALGRDSCELSYRLKTKHKGYRWFYDYTKLVYDDAGRALVVQGYLFDQTQLKSAEAALAEERESLARIIESTNAGTWEWDLKTNTVMVNERWALQLGYNRSDFMPLEFNDWRQFVHPEDIKLKDQLLERLFSREQEYYQIEYRLKHREGHWVWIQARGNVSVWGEDNRPLQVSATHTDITVRKKTEEDLQQKTAMLEDVLSSLNYPFLLINADDYTITMANDYALDEHDITLGTTKCYTVGHKEDGPCRGDEHPCPMMYIKATGQHTVVEHIHRDRVGNPQNVEVNAFPVFDDAGKLTHMIEYSVNITERKHMESALRSSEEKYRLIAENTADNITILDLDLNPIYVSPSIVKLRGFSIEEALSQSLEDILLPDSLHRARTLFAEIMAATANQAPDPNRNVTLELQEYHKDGSFVWVEASCSFLRGEDGRPTGILIVSRDISERKKSERELLHAKEQAEVANAAKTQFLANMSHEIRTPLNGIIGVLQLMQMTKLTEEQSEFLDMAKSASDSLTAVIGDILDYSRIEAGGADLQRSNFSILQLLKDTERLFYLPAQDKGLELTSSIDDDMPGSLLGDGFRLRQVLSNLVGNAIKFTQSGGVDITVKLKHRFATEVHLQFEVSDTGPGIPPDKLRGLFERFSQADSSHTRRYGGVGLGLAIAKGIVELMSGQIWVESEVGIGSTFCFTCVVEIGSDLSVEKSGCSYETTGGNDAHILVAEDDFVSRLMVEKMLQKKGWTVTTATNGREALAAFNNGSFDLILMDVQMPEMDGYTATARIRELDKDRSTHTPIIAMTAHAMQQDRADSLRAGMDEYMAKPINRDNLYSLVERFLAKA